MAKHNIRLVYSSSPSQTAVEGRGDWGLENARQLGLFDEMERIRVIFVPVEDVSARHFIRTLDENKPYLVLDTRDFPDFFSVFSSVERALDEFSRRGITYERITLQYNLNNEIIWEKLSEVKKIFSEYLERRTAAPIFILSSTQRRSEKVAGMLKGYISQELRDVKFEEISPYRGTYLD